jgi:malate dehydrogenase (oxaloacetate-decarboxylating)
LRHTECTDTHSPKDLYEWSEGKALISTGSPFPPVKLPGSDKEYIIAECNNVGIRYGSRSPADVPQALIYPGLGRGTILSKAKFMTDKMIVAGAKRLAELAPAIKDPDQALLPDFGGEPSHPCRVHRRALAH